MSLKKSSFASRSRVAPAPGKNWHAVLPQERLERLARQRPNILLIGPTSFTRAALKQIEPLVAQPIVAWQPQEAPSVPEGSYGTLLVHRLDLADSNQQVQLCEWFDTRPCHIQVVSTSPAPLFEFVEQGTFLETLYYRLNHVCLTSDGFKRAL
jgi:Sigma-54 interaction domain